MVCVDVAAGVVFELEAALLERVDDVGLVALWDEHVVGEVGGDEEDGDPRHRKRTSKFKHALPSIQALAINLHDDKVIRGDMDRGPRRRVQELQHGDEEVGGEGARAHDRALDWGDGDVEKGVL